MKVLTYTTLFPNGIYPLWGIFVYQRMAHFARRAGNKVVAVVPVPFAPGWFPSDRLRAFSRIPHDETIGDMRLLHPRYALLPKISMPLHGLLMFLGSYRTVRKLHKAEQFDCIDAHYVYPDGFAAILLGKALGIPVCVSARGTDINLFPEFDLIRPMIQWTLDQADGLIAVSRGLKSKMLKLGADPAKVRVIQNGVDTSRFYPADRSQAKCALKLPPEARIIVSVGALVPHKGFRILIPAFGRICRHYPNSLLYIIGEGADRNHLQNLIHTLELQERVFLVGSQPNESLRNWFSAAEFSCLASSREGMPNVVVESNACGAPVVATKVGGIPEVLSSPGLGVLVDESVESIAKGLDVAFTMRWNRAKIAEHAQGRSWSTVAEEVDAFFEQCLGSRID